MIKLRFAASKGEESAVKKRYSKVSWMKQQLAAADSSWQQLSPFTILDSYLQVTKINDTPLLFFTLLYIPLSLKYYCEQ